MSHSVINALIKCLNSSRQSLHEKLESLHQLGKLELPERMGNSVADQKSYAKIQRGHPFYKMLRASKKMGVWMCDSLDHNEPEGCSNPDCFKHPKEVTVSFPGLEDEE